MASVPEKQKEFVNRVCGSNRYLGDDYCDNEVAVEVKHNKKTGEKVAIKIIVKPKDNKMHVRRRPSASRACGLPGPPN